MPDEEVPKDKQPTEIVVTSKALQVAEGWVRNMMGGEGSDSEAEDLSKAELEARPPRLGLGAKYLPHSQFAATLNPVERKLLALTNKGKHREGGAPIGNRRLPLAKAPTEDSKLDAQSDDDDDEEEEVKGSSRTPHGRQQRRIGSADLLMKTSGSKGRGSTKRKRCP